MTETPQPRRAASAREIIARAFAKPFVSAYEADDLWQEDLPLLLKRASRSRTPSQDNPFAAADAILSALRDAGMVIGCIGLPGEIVAGVIQVAQRAQDYNGELVSIRVRTTEPGNVEIETDEATIALDRVDATRLAALLLRESAMIDAAEEGQP